MENHLSDSSQSYLWRGKVRERMIYSEVWCVQNSRQDCFLYYGALRLLLCFLLLWATHSISRNWNASCHRIFLEEGWLTWRRKSNEFSLLCSAGGIILDFCFTLSHMWTTPRSKSFFLTQSRVRGKSGLWQYGANTNTLGELLNNTNTNTTQKNQYQYNSKNQHQYQYLEEPLNNTNINSLKVVF